MIVGLLEFVSMWKRTDFSILQIIGRMMEKNTEERAEILQRISTNKTLSDQKDCDIEGEIAEVKESHKELGRLQESFSVQVVKI